MDELRALMEADRWLDRVKNQRAHLPEVTELATVENTLRSLAATLKEREALAAAADESRMAVTAEADRLRDRAAQLQTRLDDPQLAAKDWSTVKTELDHVLSNVTTAEDAELAALLAVDDAKVAVTAVRTEAQPLMQARTTLKESIAALEESLDEEIAALTTQRERAAGAVPTSLRDTYEAILRRVGVSGAANLDGDRCDGCRIGLPTLDIEKASHPVGESFHPCPECGRLLLP